MTAANIVAFLADIFDRRGSEEYLGEKVTMAEHMLQSAQLAEKRGCAPAVIVAALLHDIGHFTGEFGMFTMSDTHDRQHEIAGEKVLKEFFPPAITLCVRHHVAAKRYLCAKEPAYFRGLSAASVHSLRLQGGPMSPAETTEFERLPGFENIVMVRRFDDAAKIAGARTADFRHYQGMIEAAVDATNP